MSLDLQLTGKRALVAGGTRGVGAEVVRALVDARARVVAAALSPPQHPVDQAHYVAADLTGPDGVRQVVDAALEHLGGIDVLVNVVGGSSAPAGGFAVLTDDQWSRELDLNLMPAVRLDRALLPSMLRRGPA